MRAFAELLDRLSLTGSRNAKLVLLRDYLRATPDPDRGWALAALTGDLSFDAAKPAMIRQGGRGAGRSGAVRLVLRLCRRSGRDRRPDLADRPDLPAQSRAGAGRGRRRPGQAKRGEVQGLIEGWLDALAPKGRWALLKLVTGGAAGRAVGTAGADGRGHDPPRRRHRAAGARRRGGDTALEPLTAADIVEVWHAVKPPYADLFAWVEGRADRPDTEAPGRFRQVMLAVAIDEAVDFDKLDPADYAAEWKWDGIRVQAVREHGVADGSIPAPATRSPPPFPT